MKQETLTSVLQQSGTYFQKNLADVSPEKALWPSPGGANSFNWIAGHLVFWRNVILQMTGESPVWAPDEHSHYRGHPGERRPVVVESGDSLDLERLGRDFSEMEERLTRWAEASPEVDLPDHFLNLLLHEAYHAGQLGILRRALGMEGVF